MSEPRQSPGNPPTYYSFGVLAMLGFGVILLLPGACSLFIILNTLWRGRPIDINNPFTTITLIVWAIGFAISAGGVALIVFGLKRARIPK